VAKRRSLPRSAAGGGGGYSGGGGGDEDQGGGGGGSFVASSALDPVLTAGIDFGDGLVTITEEAMGVPEPSSILVVSAGLGGVLMLRRHGVR
jgi:hypothetical protein